MSEATTDKQRIRAVFFDAGNTLIYLDFELIASVVREAGIKTTADAVRHAELDARRAVDEYLKNEEIDDEMVWEIYFSTMFRGVGLTDTGAVSEAKEKLREQDSFTSLWRCVPEESYETLRRLKEQGYKLGIISNADGRLHSLLKNTGLDKMLNFAIDSKLVGYEKPDPKIFKLALEFSGETADACVHVGDIVSADVEGARGVGIQPVLIDPTRTKKPGCPVIHSISEIIALVEELNNQ